MTNDCPVCDRTALGAQIVELGHPSTDSQTYAIVCPDCGTVYQSDRAEDQMEG